MIRKRKENDPLQGRPMTNQRRLLLELISGSEGHIDAKELYRRASAVNSSISQATVYRTLNLFKEQGIIKEKMLGKVRCYFEVSGLPDHHHLVCQGCGKVMEFNNPYFDKLIEAIKAEYGFNVTKAELYLEGYCPECKEKDHSGDQSPTPEY